MAIRYLEGEGIFLSPIEEADVSVLLEMQNEKFIRDMMSSCLPKTFEDIQADIVNTKKSGSPYFLIFKESGKPGEEGTAIGYVKLEIVSSIIRASELHIAITKKYTGNGYGKQVIRLLTDYAFDCLNLHSIRALIRAKNYASQKVFESQGYRHVGTLPEWSFYDGGYHDCYIYDCIPSFRKSTNEQ